MSLRCHDDVRPSHLIWSSRLLYHLKADELMCMPKTAWVAFGTRESRHTPKQYFLTVKLPWKRKMYDICSDEYRLANPLLHFVFFFAKGPAP